MEYTIVKAKATIFSCSGDNEYELIFDEITISFTIGNDGIGGYEFWGCVGYDAGSPCLDDVVIESAIYNKRKMSEKVLNRIDIDKFLDDYTDEIFDGLADYYKDC